MLVLGIESSCDETAVAIVRDDRKVLASLVSSQISEHAPYGGVVPEIAARAHLRQLEPMIDAALRQTGLGLSAMDAVAATAGPGLIGGLMVGVMYAKAMAAARSVPFLAINHLEGHALTARLTDDVAFPYLLLLVSGGHTQLLLVCGVGDYRRLGTTIDDAAGEAFDKSAKLLGLGFPGGPALETLARGGHAARFSLPRPMKGRAGCDFSFSGLKTAVRQAAQGLRSDDVAARADLAAAVQTAIADCLADRTRNAVRMARASHAGLARLVVAGGVAANGAVREALARLCAEEQLNFVAPPLALCTDNAAMIAWAGIERRRLGLESPLDFAPRPRWPLDGNALPAIGAGVKA